jgi:hypothetical protein
MADLRAKDADPKLIDRAHLAARFQGKAYRKFIIDVVRFAVEESEARMSIFLTAKRTANERIIDKALTKAEIAAGIKRRTLKEKIKA